MIDAYKIGISLLVDTNANSEIGGMIRTFKQLDGAVVGASDAVKNLNAALRETGRLAGGIGKAAAAMDSVAAAARGVSGGLSGAAREAGAFADAMQRAAEASKAIVPAPRLLGYDGGGSGGGGMVPAPRLLGYDGGGSGGGGGYSGPRRIGGPGGVPLLGYGGGAGGLSVPPGGGGIGGIGGGAGGGAGRLLPIPAGDGGAILPGMIETAALRSAFSEELALTSTLSTLGYKPGTPEWDAAYGSLRNLAGTSAEGTIFSGAATAGFMPTAAGVSMFHGNTSDERSAAMAKFQAIFPTLLRFGETAQQSGLGSADESTAAGFGFAHMLNRYDPKDLVPALDLLFNLSRVTHSTITQEQNALKYGVPAAKAAGMSPEDAAMMTGFIQLMGFRGTTAGTGVSNVINAIHNYKPDRNGDFSEAAVALQGMGVLDANGNVVDGVAPGGHLNFGALIAKIAAYAKTQRPIDAMLGLKNAFNSRGERIAGTFEDPEAIGRLGTFTTDVKTLPGVSETQTTLAGTTGQQRQQVIARFADLLNGLVSPTLPALRLSFEGLHDTISLVKSRLDESPEGEAALGTAFLAGSSAGLFKVVARIAGQTGIKLIPAGAEGALGVAAAALGEVVVGALVFAGAAYLKSQLQSVSDRIEGAIFGNDQKTAADRKAFKDFSPFDRSTWADPNAHWWQATPKRSVGSDGPVPVYLTNPHDVGDHIERGLSGAVNAPPTGPTQFDTRLGVLQPGMAVVP